MIDGPLAIHIATTSSADVFYTILKKLSFKDMSSFYMLLKQPNPENHILLAALKKKLGSSKAIESLHGLLKLLKSMDDSVAIDAPTKHQNNVLWYFRAVMQASHTIYRRQNQEIAYLKDWHPVHERWADIDAQNLDAQDVNLEALITRHQQLDALNESIIRREINLKSRKLIINYLEISRIPEALFNDESLAIYWRNLVTLRCDGNELFKLPDSIGKLSSLQYLNCKDNRLEQLP